jgi:hypothetical protein
VVDTCGVVKDEDSEAVFWTSRLEFASVVVLLKSAMKGFFSDDDVLFINADGILTP